ncbi:hypothetical protein TVAG_167790 [Trichomonas vaginalis G3]|uniref:Uncharacterized protein n=1 Tax=Trichomonas vaginalis (strain ATCC PRA-98 / G3) TaxID=412133 RepID=A2FLB7_TRIV3|nr:major sperm protein family [Trichomonas vaginalis G3]EAX94298.1 hypothetical protein TVAG_167790 [Trichomonas vaginalis G3]KAI5510344.1 major sperm protein family [Trichomonas vaginalis G3]|eukprot:XP_001307228.1 hypothetical protein [Trichomonas vaginalis G3]
MLGFFLYQAISELVVIKKTGDNDNSNFDLKVKDEAGTVFESTEKNKGWFLVYKVNDGELQLLRGKDNGKANHEGISIETEYDTVYTSNYLTLKFKVKNDGDTDKTFSLGAFADLKLNYVDAFTVKPFQFRQGHRIVQSKNNLVFNFITNNNKPSSEVDAFWYGPNSYSYTNWKTYPYWNNLENPEEKQANVVSFSWQNRLIKPGETLELQVRLGYGIDLKSPPKIFLNEPLADRYNPNSNHEVTWTVYAEDGFNSMNFHYLDYYKGKIRSQKGINMEKSIKSGKFTLEFKEAGPYQFKFVVENAFGYKSNSIQKDIILNKLPTIKNSNQLKEKYNPSDEIELVLELFDEKSVTIHYKIDENGQDHEIPEKKECNNQAASFTIKIPFTSLEEGTHKLIMHIIDDDGFRSENDLELDFLVEAPKEQPKEDEKEQPKEDEKEQPKEDEKEQPKEDGKEQPKEDEKKENDKDISEESDDNKENDKIAKRPSRSKNSWLIPVIVISILVVVAIIVVIIFFKMKGRNESNENNDSFDNAEETVVMSNEPPEIATEDHKLFSTSAVHDSDNIFGGGNDDEDPALDV